MECLSVGLPSLFVYLSVLFSPRCMFTRLPVPLFFCLPVYLSSCLSGRLFVFTYKCLFNCLSVYLFVYKPVNLPTRLFTYLSVCLFTCLSVSAYIFSINLITRTPLPGCLSTVSVVYQNIFCPFVCVSVLVVCLPFLSVQYFFTYVYAYPGSTC